MHDGSNGDGVGSKRKLPRRRRRGSSDGMESSSKAKMTCRGVWSVVACVSSQLSFSLTERLVHDSNCGTEVVGRDECSFGDIACSSFGLCSVPWFPSFTCATESFKTISAGDCTNPAIDNGDMLNCEDGVDDTAITSP